jgi:hypothetical protein
VVRELKVKAVEDAGMRLHTDAVTFGGEEGGYRGYVTTSIGLGGLGLYLRAERDGKTVRERIDLTDMLQAWARQVDEEMQT